MPLRLREKAVLDVAYLEPQVSDRAWLEELRMDEFELDDLIDRHLLEQYTARYQSTVINNRIDVFVNTYSL